MTIPNVILQKIVAFAAEKQSFSRLSSGDAQQRLALSGLEIKQPQFKQPAPKDPAPRVRYSPKTVVQKSKEAKQFLAEGKTKEAAETYVFLMRHAQELIGQSQAEKLEEKEIADKYPEVFPCYIDAVCYMAEQCMAKPNDSARYIKAAGLYNHALVVMEKYMDSRQQQAHKNWLLQERRHIEQQFLQEVCQIAGPVAAYTDTEIQSVKAELGNIRTACREELERFDRKQGSKEPESRQEFFACEGIYSQVEARLKALIQKIVISCEQILGTAPCSYALLGLGSFSKVEMTPYSDIEFAILIADKAENGDPFTPEQIERHKQYFRNLTNLLHLKVLSLGETIVPSLNIAPFNTKYLYDPVTGIKEKIKEGLYDYITTNGFAFDGGMAQACKTPLGKINSENPDHKYELIHTPQAMVAEFQLPEAEYRKGGFHLASIMAQGVFIAGNEGLVKAYDAILADTLAVPVSEEVTVAQIIGYPKKAARGWSRLKFNRRFLIIGYPKKAAPDAKESREPKTDTQKETFINSVLANENLTRLGQVRALWLLAQDLEKYDPRLQDPSLRGKLYEVKKEIYRLTSTILDGLAMYFGLQERSVWDRIHELLVPRELIGKQGKKNLYILVSLANELRLRDVIANHGQRGRMSFERLKKEEITEQSVREAFQVSAEILKAYYYRALPYHRAMQTFILQAINTGLESTDLKEELFYEPTKKIEGLVYLRIMRFEDAVRSFKAYLETEPEDSLVLHFLGHVLMDQGDFKGAREYLERSLAISKKVYGTEDHSLVAERLAIIGQVLKAQGDLKGAREYLERSLAISKKVYGTEDHEVVFITLTTIGQLLMDQGDFKGARDYLERSLAISKKVIGTEMHPNVAVTLKTIGNVLMLQGNLKEAREYFERSLAILIKVYGTEEQAKVATTLGIIGQVLQDQGDLKGARNYLERSLAITKKVFGTEVHPDVAVTLGTIGNVLMLQGNLKGAREYLERALAIKKKVIGTEMHPDVAAMLGTIGQLLQDQGDLKGAREYFERSLAIKKRVYGTEEHAKVAITLERIGKVLMLQGDLKGARDYFERYLAIFIKVYDTEEHVNVAVTLTTIGQRLMLQGDLNGAKEYLERALAIFIKVYGTEEHPSVAVTLHTIGQVLQDEGDLKGARDYFERAFEIAEKQLGVNHHHTISFRKNLQKLIMIMKWPSLCIAAHNGNLGKVKEFVDAGADVHKMNNDGDQAIHCAIVKGHKDVVEYLLRQDEKLLEARGQHGTTPLLCASGIGNLELVRMLIARGADIHKTYDKGNQAIHIAVLNGHKDVIEYLLRQDEKLLEARGQNGATPLLCASFIGNVKLVRMLLELGAELNCADNGEETPLHIAALGYHSTVVKVLIEAGADVHKTNNDGDQAIHCAVVKGHKDVVEYLLRQDEKLLEAGGQSGATPLLFATVKGNVELVRMLIARGANIHKTTNNRHQAIHWAVIEEHKDVVEYLLMQDEKLLEAGGQSGATPLLCASFKGNLELVRMLVELGAEINCADNKGKTPLHIAALGYHSTIVKVLIEAGADINKQDNDGDTPIYLAKMKGHEDIVKLLKDAGAIDA